MLLWELWEELMSSKRGMEVDVEVVVGALVALLWEDGNTSR